MVGLQTLRFVFLINTTNNWRVELRNECQTQIFATDLNTQCWNKIADHVELENNRDLGFLMFWLIEHCFSTTAALSIFH